MLTSRLLKLVRLRNGQASANGVRPYGTSQTQALPPNGPEDVYSR